VTPPDEDRASFSGTLARIVVFPVKSLDGMDAEEARILPSGALEHDRRFAIVGRDGRFVNGKREPGVHRLRTSYDATSRRLTLRRPDDAAPRTFSLDDERALLESWLGETFGYPVEIQEEGGGGFPDDREAPGPTLVAAASLEEVSRWFPDTTPAALARRFRANLVVDGLPAFGDDRFVGGSAGPVRFRVGPVVFEGVNPCQRCAVPTRDPDTGAGDPHFAKTFAARRRETLPSWAPQDRFDHFYRFTVNTRLVPGSAGGRIRVGDRVELVDGA
jgi:uncharacterized protein YcbX